MIQLAPYCRFVCDCKFFNAFLLTKLATIADNSALHHLIPICLKKNKKNPKNVGNQNTPWNKGVSPICAITWTTPIVDFSTKMQVKVKRQMTTFGLSDQLIRHSISYGLSVASSESPGNERWARGVHVVPYSQFNMKCNCFVSLFTPNLPHSATYSSNLILE